MGIMNIVVSGLGGQGILFMTKVLSQAALDKGLDTLGAETHGMAQRGGSVISHLKFGEMKGSLVRTGTAHILLSLEENEAYRNIPFLGKGGRIYVNSADKVRSDNGFPSIPATAYLNKMEIVSHLVSATKIALTLGAPRSSNLALLGFFSAFEHEPVNHEDLREAIRKVSPDRFKKINLMVFDAGFRAASN